MSPSDQAPTDAYKSLGGNTAVISVSKTGERYHDAMPNSHDTASGTSTGVTSLERVGVTAFTKVVGTLVDDDGAANDARGAKERDVLVWDVSCGMGWLKRTGERHRIIMMGGGTVTAERHPDIHCYKGPSRPAPHTHQ